MRVIIFNSLTIVTLGSVSYIFDKEYIIFKIKAIRKGIGLIIPGNDGINAASFRSLPFTVFEKIKKY